MERQQLDASLNRSARLAPPQFGIPHLSIRAKRARVRSADALVGPPLTLTAAPSKMLSEVCS
jgi:hypothetical protein